MGASAESWRRSARTSARLRREAQTNRKTYVRFKTQGGKLGAAAGDVLITEGGVEEKKISGIVASSGGTKSERIRPQSNPNTPPPEGTTRVEISPALAEKISGSKSEENARYYVDYDRSQRPTSETVTTRREVSSGVDTLASPNQEPYVGIVDKEKVKRDLYNVKQVVSDPNAGFGRKAAAVTIGVGETIFAVGGEFIDSNIQFKKDNIYVSPEFLVGSGTLMTAKPVSVQPKSVDVKVRSAVTQQGNGEIVVSNSRILEGSEVVIKRGFLSKPIKYEVVGRTKETGVISDATGVESGESIVNTLGAGRAFLKGPKGELYLIRSSSVGNEVGVVGQRKVSLSVHSKGRSVGSDHYVESYKSVDTQGGFYGGTVSKRGSNVFIGKKLIEQEYVAPGRFKVIATEKDPFLNLDLTGQSGGARVYADFSKVPKVENIIITKPKYKTTGTRNAAIIKSKGKKGVDEVSEDVGGYYRPKTDTIAINENSPKKIGGVNVFLHEYGHSFQSKTGANSPLKPVFGDGTKEGKAVIDELFRGKNRIGTPQDIRQYYKGRGYKTAEEQEEEFFADLFSRYVEDPKAFTARFPKTAEGFGNYVGRFKQVNPNVEIRVVQEPGLSTRIATYDVRTAGQSEVSADARAVRSQIINKLQSEKRIFNLDDVQPRSVNPVAREQASAGGVVIQKTSYSQPLFNNQELMLKSAGEVIGTSQRPSTQPLTLLSSKTQKKSTTTRVVPSQQTSTRMVTSSFSNARINKSEMGTSQFPDLSGKTGSIFNSISGSSIQSGSIQSSDVITTPVSTLGLRSLQATKQETRLETKQVHRGQQVKPSNLVVQSPVTLPAIPVFIPFFKFGKGGDYSVSVRRGGQYKMVGKGLKLDKAVGLGRKVVENTAAATFKVSRGGKTVGVGKPSNNYYTKDTGEVVEKRGFRIKSSGEISEITLKGIRANRRRSVF